MRAIELRRQLLLRLGYTAASRLNGLTVPVVGEAPDEARAQWQCGGVPHAMMNMEAARNTEEAVIRKALVRSTAAVPARRAAGVWGTSDSYVFRAHPVYYGPLRHELRREVRSRDQATLAYCQSCVQIAIAMAGATP